MRAFLTAAAIVLLLVPAALASHYANFYVIPVASHAVGANNVMFMTDIAIQNFQSAPLTVELVIIEAGLHNVFNNVFPIDISPSTVPAGGTVVLKDVLNNFRGQTATVGAILIGSSDGRPFAVTSRSYNIYSEGSFVGQTVPAVRDFLENATGNVDNPTATAYLPGIINNSDFTTHLGFVAGTASGTPLFVEFTLRDASGSLLVTRPFFIGADQFVQFFFPVQDLTNQNLDSASVEVRISAGDGAVVPYASVRNNRTGDALFITGQFPPNVPFAKSAASGSVFRQLFERVTHK